MKMHCQKCSGERRVIVPNNDDHWHWEACPDCNGFEEMELATRTSTGKRSSWIDAFDAALNDDILW